MKRIAKLNAPEIINAFFGDSAEPYSYTVSADDFDEYDMDAPGHYYGVEVPDHLGARWDAGIDECRRRGIDNRSAEGYALRLSIMYPDGIPAGIAEAVEAYRLSLERRKAEAKEAKDRPRREYDAAMAKIAELASGLTPTGYGPGLYLRSGRWECHWHVFCHRTDPEISPRVEPMGEPLVSVEDWRYPKTFVSLWRTEVGYLLQGTNGVTHYVSPELAREYRLRRARLHGVDATVAAKGIDSRYIGDDQLAMYRAVLDEQSQPR